MPKGLRSIQITVGEANLTHFGGIVLNHLRQRMFYVQSPRTSLLFDLDSSVVTVYGKFIEEAKVDYNPRKRGARSYHPLFCFEANSKDSWHSILRPGDTGSSTKRKFCFGQKPTNNFLANQVLFPFTPSRLQHSQLVQEDMLVTKIPQSSCVAIPRCGDCAQLEYYFRNDSYRIFSNTSQVSKNRQQEYTQTTSRIYFRRVFKNHYPEN